MHFPLFVAAIPIMFAVLPPLHSYNFHYFCYFPYFWSLHFPLSHFLFLIHALPISCRCFSLYLSLQTANLNFISSFLIILRCRSHYLYLCFHLFAAANLNFINAFPIIRRCNSHYDCCIPTFAFLHFPFFVVAFPIFNHCI